MPLVDSPDLISHREPRTLEYWRETRRPFCNLVFLLPFLFVYEFGVGVIGSRGESIRNGADAWLRLWLGQTGLSTIWLPPVLLLGTLVTWHMFSRQPWKMTWDTLWGHGGGKPVICIDPDHDWSVDGLRISARHFWAITG